MRTSIAYQSIEELGGAGSVLVRQRRDHERLDELLRRVRPTADTEQDEVLMRICRLVSHTPLRRRPCCGRRFAGRCPTARR